MPTRTPRIPDAALSRIPGKALYRIATAGAEVVIGGDHPSLVLPEARASKWGGECWLRVRHADADEIDRADKEAKVQGKKLEAAGKASLRTEKGKPVLDIPTPGKGRRHEIREGSLKWDVVYDSPAALPADGIERFQLEFPAGLTWHYQPELTPEEIAEGADRPDNVVGSYAGYFDRSGRIIDANGEEIANYETGKFAHLYRPEMIDSAGNRCWAVQELVGSELRITLPAEWMATAEYPVRLDPTFGYESIGASASTSGNVRGLRSSLGEIGSVTSISAYYTSLASQSGSVGFAIYDTALNLIAESGSVSLSALMWPPTAHSAWYSAPVDTGVLAAGNYALMAFSGATTNGRVVNYDSVSSYTYFLSSVATTAPDPFGGAAGTTSLRYSIYATYEESGGGGTTVTTTKGSLSLTASPISIDVSLVLDTGAINLTGDNLGTKVNVTLDIGSLLTSGKEISQDVSAILSSGSVTFTGQDLTFATVIALNLDTGELTFVGDNVAFDVTIHLDKGDFAVSGKQVLINGEVVARKISKMFGFELNLWS